MNYDAKFAKNQKISQMAKKQKKRESDGPEKHKTPWAHAHPKVTVNFSTKWSEEQHLQMKWLVENMPGRQSFQKLVHAAVVSYVAQLLKQYYTQ